MAEQRTHYHQRLQGGKRYIKVPSPVSFNQDSSKGCYWFPEQRLTDLLSDGAYIVSGTEPIKKQHHGTNELFFHVSSLLFSSGSLAVLASLSFSLFLSLLLLPYSHRPIFSEIGPSYRPSKMFFFLCFSKHDGMELIFFKTQTDTDLYEPDHITPIIFVLLTQTIFFIHF